MIQGPLGGTFTTERARRMIADDPTADACNGCDAHKTLTTASKA